MAVRSFDGNTPVLGERLYIDDSAVIIGRVTIGDDSSIWPTVVARGDVHQITIGTRTNVQDGAVLHVTHPSQYGPAGAPLVIGDEVTVGHRAVLHACTVGNRCLIGMGAVVMDEAVIQDNVVLGAGSLVSPHKVLESGFLYLGSPARKVRALTEAEIDFLAYSADHYVHLKDKYLK